MRRARRALALALACMAAAAAAGAAAESQARTPPRAPAAALPTARLSLGPGERLLIVAPHPDDEVLCCAGLALRAIAAGAQVSVVWVTSGDAFELDALLVERTLPGHQAMRKLASDRMREAQAATTLLGIPAGQRWFLGYPDRGIRRLLTDFYARPYTSKYTGASAVPYDNALAPGTAYEGHRLEYDLGTVIDTVRPTLVLAPSPLDRHRDHGAVGDLVLRLMSRRAAADSVRYWIVHAGRTWPAPRRYAPTAGLTPPPATLSLDWSTVPLQVNERDAKLAALRLYRSQWRIMEPFLASFVRQNELFAALSYPPETSPPRFERDAVTQPAAATPGSLLP